MNSNKKYKAHFGSISSLSSQVPWTTGLSNLIEFVTWETKAILGISKTEFWKLILKITEDDGFSILEKVDKEKQIKKILEKEIAKSEVQERLTMPKASYCSPREALRRVRYFSEDYLNKEFDIFLSLCSDRYLNYVYSGIMQQPVTGNWSTHGNSGLFWASTELTKMQMDNLAYNESVPILIANELKLGSKKNPDQLLKYAYLYQHLLDREFFVSDTAYVVLFIGDKEQQINLKQDLDKEVAYCKKADKKFLLSDSILEQASSLKVFSTTWMNLRNTNIKYLNTLDDNYEVERKLIEGFNSSLEEKAFLNGYF